MADADQNVIYVIDGSTNTVVGNVTVGNNPESIAVDLITNKLYVSNINSNTVSVIDYLRDSQEPVFVGKLVKNITGFEDPLRVAVDPIINNVYVINRNNDTISVIDGSTYNIIGNIAVGTFPSHMAVNTNSHTLYVRYCGFNLHNKQVLQIQ